MVVVKLLVQTTDASSCFALWKALSNPVKAFTRESFLSTQGTRCSTSVLCLRQYQQLVKGCVLYFKQRTLATSCLHTPFSLYLLYVLSLCIFIPSNFSKKIDKEQEKDKNNKIKEVRLKEITFQNHVIPDSSPHIAISKLFSNKCVRVKAFTGNPCKPWHRVTKGLLKRTQTKFLL